MATKLSPQQIRAIKNSPKGKIPPFLNEKVTGQEEYRNSRFGKAVDKYMHRPKLKKPLEVKTGTREKTYEDGSSEVFGKGKVRHQIRKGMSRSIRRA